MRYQTSQETRTVQCCHDQIKSCELDICSAHLHYILSYSFRKTKPDLTVDGDSVFYHFMFNV